MPQFQNGAASIHYEMQGSGPPLLLIAGTASDGTSWRPLLPLLPDRRLILIDNRASGQSRVEGPVQLKEMVDDCAALIDHLKLGAVDIIGHSLGGFLALALAARNPEKVSRVVTLGAGTLSPKDRIIFRDLARLYFVLHPEDWFRLLYPWLFSDPFFADEANVAAAAAASTAYAFRQSPEDFARQIKAIDEAPGVDLSSISCDVLAIAGGLDLLAPPQSVIDLHTGVANVEHLTIPESAHSLHWEAPQAVAKAINGFLG